ncbi:MAG: tetratricopeptide repeat protein [Bacteroidota bacterium]
MPDNPNKLTQFWQEIKRRGVIKVITMYAATAFIIMEAGDIMFPRLGLPDWTVTFIIILLIVGFPIAIILSWIFDLTPDGIKKTEPQKRMKSKMPPEQERRKLKPSDIIIATLLVVVCILAYPRVFNKDELKDIRDEEGKISVAVMPFENLTGDTLYNVWQGGFQNLLISNLSNSGELQVRQYQTMSIVLGQKKNVNQASVTPSLARELAYDLETRTFILGKILKAGNKIRVNAQLVNAETEEVYKTYQVEGQTEDDVFDTADSLSGMIRNYLEIRKLAEVYDSPEVTEAAFTNSAEAFQYYIHAWDAFEKMDLQATIEWMSKAIETDSSFVDAYIFLSFTYTASNQSKQAKIWCKRAYNKRDELPLRGKLFLDHLYAYYYETPQDEIKICKQILEIDEMNSTYWFFLGDAYHKLNQYNKAAFYWEKALEIHKKWGTSFGIPHLYYRLGDSYHHLGDHKREREVYALGLSAMTDDPTIIGMQAACALSQGDTDEANKNLNKYKSVGAARNWNESRILAGLGLTYLNARLIDEAEKQYRQALTLDPENPYRMHELAWCLINNDIHIDEGVELVEKAVEVRPDDSYMLDTWGWGLYKQGQYEEALKILKQSWELRGPYSPVIYQHLQEAEKAIAR